MKEEDIKNVKEELEGLSFIELQKIGRIGKRSSGYNCSRSREVFHTLVNVIEAPTFVLNRKD